MTVGLREQLGKKLPKVETQNTSGLVEQLREVKDKDEIAEIRQAGAIAERALAMVRHLMLPERTEQEVADDLEYQMRLFGAKGRRSRRSSPSAAGRAAARPAGRADDRRRPISCWSIGAPRLASIRAT